MTQHRFGKDHIGNHVFGIMGQENKSPLKSAMKCIADAYAKEMDEAVFRSIFPSVGSGQSKQIDFGINPADSGKVLRQSSDGTTYWGSI